MQKISLVVITDNYGNISRFVFRDPDLIDRKLQEISVYLNTSQYMPDLTVSHEFFNISASTRWDLDMIMMLTSQAKLSF